MRHLTYRLLNLLRLLFPLFKPLSFVVLVQATILYLRIRLCQHLIILLYDIQAMFSQVRRLFCVDYEAGLWLEASWFNDN